MRRGSVGSRLPLSPSESVDQAVETYGLQKITLLREISLKTGIQVGAGPCPFVPVGVGSPHMCCVWVGGAGHVTPG